MAAAITVSAIAHLLSLPNHEIRVHFDCPGDQSDARREIILQTFNYFHDNMLQAPQANPAYAGSSTVEQRSPFASSVRLTDCSFSNSNAHAETSGLQLTIRHWDRQAAEMVAGQVAHSIVRANEIRLAEATRRHEHIANLEHAMQQTLANEVRAARDAVETHSAHQPNGELSSAWDALASQITQAQEELLALRERQHQILTQLHQPFDERTAMSNFITDEIRNQTYAGIPELQQDMAELTTHLTLGRDRLEAIARTTAPRLDELIVTCSLLTQVEGITGSSVTDPEFKRETEQFLTFGGLYHRRLDAFSRTWNEAMTGLQSLPADPLNPRLLISHEQLRTVLGDFQFYGGRLLADLRESVQSLSERAQAHENRACAEIKRRFHRLEADHRRLEFAASDIYPRNDFRLDAALRSAEGLSRRVSDRVRLVDAQLLQEAAKLARQAFEQTHSANQSELHLLRNTIDSLTDKIISLIEEKSRWVQLSGEAQQATASAELSRHRLRATENLVTTMQEMLIAYRNAHAQPPPGRIALRGIDVARDDDGQPWRSLSVFAAGLMTLISTGLIVQRIEVARKTSIPTESTVRSAKRGITPR